MMIRLPGWNPDVRRSRSRYPDAVPGHVGAGLVQRRDALEALLQQLVDVRELAGDALLREVEDDLLAGRRDPRLAWAFPPEARDLAPRG